MCVGSVGISVLNITGPLKRPDEASRASGEHLFPSYDVASQAMDQVKLVNLSGPHALYAGGRQPPPGPPPGPQVAHQPPQR